MGLVHEAALSEVPNPQAILERRRGRVAAGETMSVELRPSKPQTPKHLL